MHIEILHDRIHRAVVQLWPDVNMWYGFTDTGNFMSCCIASKDIMVVIQRRPVDAEAYFVKHQEGEEFESFIEYTNGRWKIS